MGFRAFFLLILVASFVSAEPQEVEQIIQELASKTPILKLPPDLQPTLICQPDQLPEKTIQSSCTSGSKKKDTNPSLPSAPSPSPANDKCADAQPITIGTYISQTCSAGRDGSTTCQPSSSAPDIWYVFTPEADTTVTMNTFGSNYDTMLSVHSACPGTSSNQIVCNDDCGSPDSCLTFNASAGNSYWIRTAGFQQDAGRIVLNISPEGSIAGRITTSDTEAGLAGTQVLIYTKDAEFVKFVTTDSNGNYLANGLATGSYIVRTLNSAGYIDEIFENVICEGIVCTPAGATFVSVTGGTSTSVPFVLERGGDVHGIVTDVDTGLPLEGIEVHTHDLSNNHISIGFTDATGRYDTMDGLPAGSYVVLALNHDGFVDELYDDVPCVRAICSLGLATRINITPGTLVDNINFGLKTGGRIEGMVTDSETGQPISGVQIVIHNSAGIRISSASSNATGNYSSFDGLPTGTYFVRTNNFKHYIDELHDGIVCPAGTCNETSGTPVLLTVGSQTQVNFSLELGGMISGKIIDRSSGEPIQGVLIDLYDSVGNHLNYDFPDSTGNYSSLIGLPQGNYFLKTLNQQGYIDQLYERIRCVASNCNPLTGTPVFVEPGNNAEGIDFVLLKGSAIGGTITESASGLPLSDVFVLMFDSSLLLTSFGVTNGCGEYTSLHGISDDEYRASTLNDLGLIDEVYDDLLCLNGCDYSKATLIPLSLGEKAGNIDFELSSMLLRDDFLDGIVTWNVKSGTWTEKGDFFTGTPDGKQNKAAAFAAIPWTPSGANNCSRCTVETVVNTTGGEGGKIVLRTWNQNAANSVELTLKEDKDRWKFKQIANGVAVATERKTKIIEPGVNYHLKLRYDGTQFQLWVDDELLMTVPSDIAPSGNAGFEVKNTSASFDYILIY